MILDGYAKVYLIGHIPKDIEGAGPRFDPPLRVLAESGEGEAERPSQHWRCLHGFMQLS